MTSKQINAQLREVSAQLSNAKAEEREALQAKFNDLKAQYEVAYNEESNALMDQQREALAKQNQPKMDSKKAFREMIKAAMGSREGIVLGRETAGVSESILTTGKTNNLVSAGAIPTTIKELLPLLQNALIYDKLGLQIATGVKGDIVWPALAAGTTVSVNGEAATVGDSEITFSKVQANPVRLAVATNITNEAIDNAAFDLQAVVTNNITEALKQFINTALFRTTAVSDGFDGPFVNSAVNKVSISATPTFAEILSLKAAVATNNVQMVGAAYACNATTYALLEATPKAAGQGGFLLEDGKIAGYPVFCSEAIADNKLCFGCFGYAALNNHGEVRLIVDPYSLSAAGKVKITLDSQWSLSTLRPKAFAIGTIATA